MLFRGGGAHAPVPVRRREERRRPVRRHKRRSGMPGPSVEQLIADGSAGASLRDEASPAAKSGLQKLHVMGTDHHLLILRRRRLFYRVTRAEGARRRRLFAGAKGANWLAGCTSLSALEMLCCVLLEGPIFSKGRLRRAPSAKAFGLTVHPHYLLLVQVLQTGL